jgi:Cdc6-like AAA superfamily ATPase
MLSLHPIIENKLESYRANKNVPNILFYGPPGCGKSTLLNNFLKQLYAGENSETLCLYVNCAHCANKGIKFIREDLKMFAKMRTSLPGKLFKSVILINGDELTIDAQSALRRCIELFSLSTRFFMLVENKRRIMTPILSRFCEIYVPLPLINGIRSNLHTHFIKEKAYLPTVDFGVLHDFVEKINSTSHPREIMSISKNIYENGFTALDIMQIIKKSEDNGVIDLIVYFDNIRKKCYNEELIIFLLLDKYCHHTTQDTMTHK